MSIPLNRLLLSMFTATVTCDWPAAAVKLVGAPEQSVVLGSAMQTMPGCARTGWSVVGTAASTVSSSRIGTVSILVEVFKVNAV